ncbi:hypothetical protein ARMSODRAFT_1024367 [Armillaria solidipes]|uniref:Uncharacterized protein n=1 Tax=Armillaria solidipes TaxID=1076256 RepID=A0A2H3BGW3_9AGAR|nr:hypothetical protein ARMSODRAFT_1024367 [Armillaria solidipes]
MDKTLQANTLTHPSHSTSACPTCGSISLRSEAVREPPSAALLKLLQSNNLPSDVERGELIATASAWTSQISDIDQDIAQVQETLKALILKRNGVIQNLNSVKSALHPIRSISDSILREIFMLCVKGWDDFVAATTMTTHDSLDSRHPPWTLSQVSHQWRRVALSTPQLWSSISLNFSTHKSYRDLSWSFKFGIHLQRAGHSRLVLSISSYNDIAKHHIMPMLLTSTSQWGRLRVKMPFASFSPLSFSAKYLNSLIQLIIDDPVLDDHPCTIDTFRIAPSIVDFKTSPRVARYLDLPWKNLVNFQCEGLHSDRSLQLLGKFESAERLSLQFGSCRVGCGRLREEVVLPRVSFLRLCAGDDYAKTTIADFFSKAKLPFLTTLILVYNHLGKLEFPVIDVASCSRLQTLDIKCKRSHHAENPKRIAAFLSTTPNISSLTICANGLNKVVISKLIRQEGEDAMPYLQVLDLRGSEITVRHELIVDMVLSRCKELDAPGSMCVLLEKLCLDEPLVLKDLRAASRWEEAAEHGLHVCYGKDSD